MKRFFKATFTVKTKNAVKLLNRVKGVEVFGIIKKPTETQFAVRLSDKTQIVDILRQSLYNDFKIAEVSPFTLLKKYAAVFIAAALFFITSLTPCFYVLSVDISAEGEGVKKKVESVVKEYVSPFTAKAFVDVQTLENAVLSIDGVAFTEIKIVGGKLTVFAVGEKLKETPEIYDNVYSKRSGVITKIVTLSGDAAVAVGDRVKKGDLLISGCVTDKNGGKSVSVNAVGEAYGIETSYYTKIVYKNSVKTMPTGQKKTVRTLKLLDKEFKTKPPFKRYNLKTSEEYLCKNFLLPIMVVSYEYEELIDQVVTADLDYEKTVALSKAQQDGEEFFGKVLSKFVETEEFEDYYLISVKTETERKFN